MAAVAGAAVSGRRATRQDSLDSSRDTRCNSSDTIDSAEPRDGVDGVGGANTCERLSHAGIPVKTRSARAGDASIDMSAGGAVDGVAFDFAATAADVVAAVAAAVAAAMAAACAVAVVRCSS